MRTRFQNYNGYADATIADIFTADELKGAKKLHANYFKTTYFQNNGSGKLLEKPLPVEAQISPVFTIHVLDFNQDGHQDLLLCGNSDKARLRFGKYDANYGVLLKGDGKGGFEYIPQTKSGFNIIGDVRSVVQINNKLFFGINQKTLKTYQLQ